VANKSAEVVATAVVKAKATRASHKAVTAAPVPAPVPPVKA
jgi:hypothetical protein